MNVTTPTESEVKSASEPQAARATERLRPAPTEADARRAFGRPRGWPMFFVALAATLGAAIAMSSLGTMLTGSNVAGFLGFAAVIVVFGGGYQLWLARVLASAGAMILPLLLRFAAARLFGRRTDLRAMAPKPEEWFALIEKARKMSRAFLWVSLPVAALGGLLLGGFAPDGSRAVAASVFGVAVVAYGVGLYRLAYAGWLPIPDEA